MNRSSSCIETVHNYGTYINYFINIKTTFNRNRMFVSIVVFYCIMFCSVVCENGTNWVILCIRINQKAVFSSDINNRFFVFGMQSIGKE